MNKFLLKIITVMTVLTSTISTVVYADEESKSDDSSTVRILFTHDLHDHIDSYRVTNTETGEPEVIGGYAQLAGTIAANRNDHTILVDAGDFSMGTFYNALFEKSAPDLSLLGMMGYDATTLGNHEFDYGVASLTKMIESSTNTPPILCSNLTFGEDEESQALKKAWEDHGGAEYKIIERGGYKIGLFGVMGEDSVYYTAAGSNTFPDRIEVAKKMVQKLKEEGVQVIVCLSHSGTNKDPSKSEDEILAQKVDGIDVIISGHTHTVLTEPIHKNKTWIVSAGCFGKYLGLLDINAKTKEKIDYQLIPITAESPVDQTISAKIQEYKTDVNENYLKQYGYTMDQSIGYTNFPLTDVYEDYSAFTGNSMADLITDAYVYASKLTTKDTSFTIGLTAKGIIRSGLVKGDITVGEVYDAVNLGKGNDGLLGYPLIRVYMKGSDLIKVAELDRSVGKDMMVDGQLYFSGMQYHYSDYRFILNHVVDAEVRTNAGFYIPVEKDKLYPVVTNLYIANMLPSVGKKTFNQLDIHTYDASGHEIKDFSDMILYNADGTELKEWQAITRYISDMDKVNGVSEMKAQYQTARDQKIKDKHFSFIRFFQNTSAFGYRIYLAIIIAIVALLGIIRLITYLIRRQREKKMNIN